MRRGTFANVGGARPWRAARRTDAGWRRPTTTTTATAGHRDQLDRRPARRCCATPGQRGHWLEVTLRAFAPGAVVTAVLPDGRRLVRELHAGQQLPLLRGSRASTSGSGRRDASTELIVRFPDGTTTRLADVAADRVVVRGARQAGRARQPRASSYLRRLPPALGRTLGRARLGRGRARAIRRDVPARPSRRANLFHLSAAMWDAWAAYDPKARRLLLDGEASTAPTSLAARSAAISFAAYRLLLWRASYGAERARLVRAADARPCARCATGRASRHARGQPGRARQPDRGGRDRVRTDGRLARGAALPRPELHGRERAPRRRPAGRGDARPHLLAAARARPGRRPGRACPFPRRCSRSSGRSGDACARSRSRRLSSLDPGPPPTGDPSSAAYKRAAVDAIRAQRHAGSESAVGDDARRPGTRSPTRSPTPRAPAAAGARDGWRRDVKLYFALNGALHDAAIAAWRAKREYQAVRPISMVRSLAFAGQSSDPRAASYSRRRTYRSSRVSSSSSRAPRARAGRATRRSPSTSGTSLSAPTAAGCSERGGRRAQPTPPYPGWVSDESAFARAAAVVLRNASGAPYGSAAAAGLAGVRAGTETAADAAAGRRLGSSSEATAWKRAERYAGGAASAPTAPAAGGRSCRASRRAGG